MTYLESMNSGKSTFSGGIPAAGRMQDPKGFSMPQGDNSYLSSYAKFLKEAQDGLASAAADAATSAKDKIKQRPQSSGSAPVVSAEELDYLNADLAKHYGMDKATAYNEAMANTAYQRAMSDMKAAGLNPALLAQSGYGSPAQVTYAQSQRSGSGYSSGSGSASGFSSGAGIWQGLASLAAAAAVFLGTKSKAGTAAAALAARSIASVAGQSAKNIFNALKK